MKMTRLRVVALALIAVVATFFGSITQASAATYVSVRVGGPPPPPPAVVYRPWAAPYRGAVWIPGHNEWINGRWVWVGGYYTYPPRRGGYWVQPHYKHGYYYPGRWAY
jgi:hypothetical protein